MKLSKPIQDRFAPILCVALVGVGVSLLPLVVWSEEMLNKRSIPPAEILAVSMQPTGLRIDWTGDTNAWHFVETRSGIMSTGEWSIVVAFPPPSPPTNAVVVQDLQERAVFRIRMEQ